MEIRFRFYDKLYGFATTSTGLCIVVLVGIIFATLSIASMPIVKKAGIGFLFSTDWDPVASLFGALPFVCGTLATAGIALLICLPFSLAIALLLSEYYPQGKISVIMRTVIELMAGIPSVVYGFWTLMYLVPQVRAFESVVGYPAYGVGIFSASVILAIMIIPYTASLSREVLLLVPQSIKDAAYSLGATRFEVVTKVSLPYARSGIIAGVFLALGRALGETMAVTMVIGNMNKIPTDIFAPANTMASIIANEFTEATDTLHISALMGIACILFLITVVINILGRLIIKKTAHH
ncbi:MAG: phosphate ABC transporter permease subunit PstC [Chitinivibrionales bacterium]|nr:phosphate ABC transporter permease subunit PstC [Chitinivibrionales bacterium]